ncbi:MAG: hypothetical protein WD058_04410 [Dehalococcoidia bacterium]
MPDLPVAPSAARTAALHLLATWMGERFYRTFRPVEDADPAPFDAVLRQRERRIGVTLAPLWDEAAPVPGADALAALLTADMEAEAGAEGGAYAVWVPPRATLPADEPAASNLRVVLERGLKHLDAGERREVRIPATVKLAKLQTDGAYVSVAGGLAPLWLAMSEGAAGSFHLDSRAIHRLPEEEAETEILVTRVRDRATMLEPGELTDIALHDYWAVSRLPAGAPAGVHVVAAPPEVDPGDGAAIRRAFRQAVNRAVEQKRAGDADLGVLAVVGPFAHLKDEIVTASLKGMNPALYGALDLIVLVAAGGVRQVLQPRSLPWEQQR